MKSLRLLTVVFIALAAANSWAADSKKASPSATPAAKDKSGLPDPVAIVEGKKIKRAELEAEFDAEVAKQGQTLDALTPDQKLEGYHYVLEDMIIDRLLKSRSADVKVSADEVDKQVADLKTQVGGTDADFAAALKKNGLTLDKLKENIHVQLQQRKWIDSQIGDKANVTDADAKDFYDKNPDKFAEPKSIRVSHILIMIPKDATPEVEAAKEKLAKDTKERITKGEDFAKVAGEVSEDPDSKDKGGDLVDYIPEGSMKDTLPEFEAAAFKLKKGEVSDPVKTKLGWHIIKVTDIKDAQTVAFADVKDRLLAYLKEDKKKQAVNDLLDEMRKKSDAKVFLPPLPKSAAQPDDSQGPAGPGAAPAPASQPGADAPPADQKAPAKELGAP